MLCMRAFLVLLMFTLLPLQFSAAAVAACCGHMDTIQALRATHHQPAQGPAAVVNVGVEDAVTDGSSFNVDCGTCHSNCAAAVTTTTATLPGPSGIDPAALLVESLLSSWHEQPYRPQWSTPSGSGWNAVA
jgi:hypothetical protein